MINVLRNKKISTTIRWKYRETENEQCEPTKCDINVIVNIPIYDCKPYSLCSYEKFLKSKPQYCCESAEDESQTNVYVWDVYDTQ